MYHKSSEEKQLLLSLFSEVYDDNFWSLGKKTEEAEELCKERVFKGAKNTLLVNDGTHAIELCLKDINVKHKYVALPVMTVPMVGWAIEKAGGIPLFIDVDLDLQMNVDQLERAYQKHGDDIGAVILVHTGGLITPRINEFVTFCKERSLPLVEDISHAQCSYFEINHDLPVSPYRHYAGTFGDYAAFSMYATKVISAGEGGFAAKRGDIEGMRTLRNQGKNRKQQWTRKGYNYRPSEWIACVAIAKLTYLQNELDHRRSLAALYEEAGIKGVHQSSLLYRNIKMVPSFYKYIIRVNPLVEESLTYKSGAVHREVLDTKEKYPTAKVMSNDHVCLALHSMEAVKTTIDELKRLGVFK